MTNATDNMDKLEIGISNFDHTIDDEVEQRLKARPREVYAPYYAWDFYGRVWWDGDSFNCEIWKHHVLSEVFTEPTLEEIMESVSEIYGWD